MIMIIVMKFIIAVIKTELQLSTNDENEQFLRLIRQKLISSLSISAKEIQV